MAIFITAFMRRSSTERITFKDASGAAISVLGTDKVRIKIGRAGDTPLLDIVTGGNTGSTVDAANPATLNLSQNDLKPDIIPAGVYDVEASIVDSSDNNKIKHAESGVFSLGDTPLGVIV